MNEIHVDRDTARIHLTISIYFSLIESFTRSKFENKCYKYNFRSTSRMPVSRNYWYRIWGAHRHV
jgi:hypothetical protein